MQIVVFLMRCLIYRFRDIQDPNKSGTQYDYQPCIDMSSQCGDGTIRSVAVCTTKTIFFTLYEVLKEVISSIEGISIKMIHNACIWKFTLLTIFSTEKLG